MNWKKWNRKIHFWGSLLIVLPLFIVICTGVLLLLKKDVSLIQPTTQLGVGQVPTISFERILLASQSAKQANIHGWQDIERLDVRPDKGLVKVRAHNRWEVQIDTRTGRILQVARRNSDLIEQIHDGTWFHQHVKLWILLPMAITLLVMLMTGMYLFIITLARKFRVAQKRERALQSKA